MGIFVIPKLRWTFSFTIFSNPVDGWDLKGKGKEEGEEGEGVGEEDE